MRKILLVLVAFMLIFALVGCNMGVGKQPNKNAPFKFLNRDLNLPDYEAGTVVYQYTKAGITGTRYGGTNDVYGQLPAPLQNCGPTVYNISAAGLECASRTDNWHGVDIQTALIKEFLVDGIFEYEVSYSGTPAGIKLGEPAGNYGNLATGASPLKWEATANYGHDRIRVQADTAVAAFTITEIKITYKGSRYE